MTGGRVTERSKMNDHKVFQERQKEKPLCENTGTHYVRSILTALEWGNDLVMIGEESLQGKIETSTEVCVPRQRYMTRGIHREACLISLHPCFFIAPFLKQ